MLQTKLEIFFSCSQSREDERLRSELERHLGFLEQEGYITIWHTGKLAPGTEYQSEVTVHLNKAHIILLLLSADFIASHSCYHIELKRALERHEAGEAFVIPILLRAIDIEEAQFAHLQFLPLNKKPIASWPKSDEVFSHIATHLRKIVKETLGSQQTQGIIEEFVDRESLFNTLIRLDYKKQARVFQQFKSDQRQIGAFLIHGDPSCGQSWLLNRLIRQLPHSSTAWNFTFSFERKACGRSLKDLGSELAKRVGLKHLSFQMDMHEQYEVIKRVYGLWQRQTVILILSKLHEIDELDV